MLPWYVSRNIIAERKAMQTNFRARYLPFPLLLATVFLFSSFSSAQAQEIPLEPYSDDYTIVNYEATPGGYNSTVRVNVSQDTFLSSANPNNNYGGDTNLRLGWEAGQYNALRTMIQYDLGGIPSNATINSARLYIYQFQSIPTNDSSMTFRAQYVNSSWGEYSVTWNNANYLGGDPLPLESISNTDGWKSSDVTGLILAWHNGSRSNHGLIITGDEVPANNRSRILAAKESGLASYIEVDYSVQCDTIAPSAWVENNLNRYEPGTFLVSWTGQDTAPSGCAPSGIAYYDVYYRINGGSWVHWKHQTQATSNHFKNYASNSDFVELTARAADRAGNVGSIPGPQASTTIDTYAPVTAMTPLPQFTTSNNFIVSWSGSDNLSGIANYDLQVRINGGNWQNLVQETTQTSYQVTGAQANTTYDFRVRATDNAGNIQDFPESAQASTTVRTYPVAHVSAFSPPILKPTATITDSFIVNWSGYAASGTEIVSFRIMYQYQYGPWVDWQTFSGTQLSAVFPWEDLGLGDGSYGFQAIATNNLGQSQPQSEEAQAWMYVDMADVMNPSNWLPIISKYSQ